MTQDTQGNPLPMAGSLCAAYAPLLPLLHTGELTDEQAASTQEHLAGCVWCRQRLAEYDTLYASLRSRFDPEAVAAGVRIPSAREIAALSVGPSAGNGRAARARRDSQPDDLEHDVPTGRGYVTLRRAQRIAAPFQALAALFLIALLGGLLLWQHSQTPAGPPALDAQSQAYVAVVRSNYLPLLDAIGAESRQCVTAFDGTPASDKPQAMADCRPLEVTAQTSAQTLLDHLQAAPAPPRWKSADEQLKAWAQGDVTFYTERIQVIDAHDVARFKTLGDQGTNDQSECSAIEQINADLPADAQFPPNAAGYCG